MPTTPTGYENGIKLPLGINPLSIAPGQPGYEDIKNIINSIHILNTALGYLASQTLSPSAYDAFIARFS